jgi:hypothetical protein
VSIVVGIFSAVMFLVIGGFSTFHCCLVLQGKTTKEQIKGVGEDGGGKRTIACCGRPASLLRLR